MVCDMIPGQQGGSFISTLRFAELLNSKGHHAIILAAKDSGKPPVQSYNGIPIYQFFSLPVPGSHRFYFYSLPSAREIKNIFVKERIEIVHIMFPSYSCYAAARVAKKMGIPVVAHSHTQPENVTGILPKLLKRPWVDRLVLRYLVWFVKRGRVVITPSELGKAILKSGDAGLNVEILSNGIDMAKFKKMPSQPFLAKYGISEGSKILLFIGRLSREKNAETLVRSIPLVLSKEPRAQLIIIGKGPLLADMRALCDSLRVAKRVSLLERVSDEDLLMAYNACEIYVHPSMVELEGMVVLEAMACGKPILIADSATSASRYFVKENGLLFDPLNPEDLAQKAVMILSDDALSAKMGNNSLLDARKYDIHESVKKLEDIYYSVLEKPGNQAFFHEK